MYVAVPPLSIGSREAQWCSSYYSGKGNGLMLLTHPDQGVWRDACPSIRKLLSVYESTGDVAAAVTSDCGPSWAPITPAEYGTFWEVLIGDVVGTRGWTDIAAVRARAAAAFAPGALHRMRLVYGALQALWLHKGHTLMFGKASGEAAAAATAAAPTVFHLSLLGNVVMCRGPAVFAACLKEVAAQRGPGGVVPDTEVWRIGKEANLRCDPGPGFLLLTLFEGQRVRVAAATSRLVSRHLGMPLDLSGKPSVSVLPGALYCLEWLLATPPLAPGAAWETDTAENFVATEKRGIRWCFPDDDPLPPGGRPHAE